MKQQYQWWIENVPKETEKFVGWLGTINDVSRVWLRNFIRDNSVKSALDVACGVAIDKDGFNYDGLDVKYRGIDISEFLVNKNKDRGYDCILGNIENIPEPDKSWELVFGRHIIEHVEYYEKAIAEMCRVATKYVVIIHFIQMRDMDKTIIFHMDGSKVYHNEYKEDKFVEYCERFGTVIRIPFDDGKQSITLIKL
jgi:ubiquinone/menaquinone biosynthesis C-methylase UbiE